MVVANHLYKLSRHRSSISADKSTLRHIQESVIDSKCRRVVKGSNFFDLVMARILMLVEAVLSLRALA